MPSTAGYPFDRLAVDHLVEGGSRVWWRHSRAFCDEGPLIYQLQAGNTGLPNATDWVDVGLPVTNGYFAIDDTKRQHGKRLLTHYRVKLVTATETYVSQPAHTFGELTEKDWLLAREIVRKETLLDKFTATEGYLIKRLRFGQPCAECMDPLTDQVTDSKCPQCKGTGFKVGYHAPWPLCLDMEPETISERRGESKSPGQAQYTETSARVTAFPAMSKEDIWVDAKDDRRWAIHDIKHIVTWRGVPLVDQVTMRLIPFTDVVYRIGVGGEADDHALEELPGAGDGAIAVTHDYGGEDALAYTDDDGCGIVGATILIFRKADWDAGLRTAASACASTTTLANGRWSYALMVDAGDYVLSFEKTGEYGPDTTEITVEGASVPVAAGESSSSSFFSSFGSV